MKKILLSTFFSATMLASSGLIRANEFSSFLQSAWPETDFSLATIEPREIMSGGPPKDGIPPIDEPQFDAVSEASEWLGSDEPVIAVVANGISRAYPLRVLTWHEIVNDDIGGLPASITFCPLCNASIVFDRRLDGQVLDFGTTGLLRFSDLVMYDRQTESWWQQFTGEAIVGELTGSTLQRIPSAIVSFASFAAAYPDGQVLNQDTGISRPYGQNPYPGYDDINSSPFLFRGKKDNRLPPMERVIGIRVDGHSKIYPFDQLTDGTVIHDTVGSTQIVVIRTGDVLSALDDREIGDSRQVAEVVAWHRSVDGSNDALDFEFREGAVYDVQTNSRWNFAGQAVAGPLQGKRLQALDTGVHFAFAWLAFDPATNVWQ